MRDFAKLPSPERDAIFLETANRRGLSRLVVEKDFWVCFTLALLFDPKKFGDLFVFKGGTSLSKVFGMINRFSEDIDLSLDPGRLGFGGEKRPDAATTRSQFEKRRKKLEQTCASYVENSIRPQLEESIRDILGNPKTDGGRFLDIPVGTGTWPSMASGYVWFEIDSQSNSPILIFRYPTVETAVPGYISPSVKLELGSLTDQIPTGKHAVSPWVADEFPASFQIPSCEVVALEAERTFWEKATILHVEFHRPSDKPMAIRLSRHYYDLCRMADHETGKRALADLKLLAQVVKYKQTYFRSAWANYETANPGTFHITPPEHRRTELKRDYQQMREMFIETPPEFEALLEKLGKIERGINKV